jgi:hypothetical protein
MMLYLVGEASLPLGADHLQNRNKSRSAYRERLLCGTTYSMQLDNASHTSISAASDPIMLERSQSKKTGDPESISAWMKSAEKSEGLRLGNF